MIKIEDEKGLLNLNHMAIYLMLTAEEIALYSDKLKDLNRYTSLTRKLFRFDIIEKGDAPYEELPDAMKRNMRHYNVLVRLVNSIHGIFCYGMEEIDFKADLPEIVKELKIFIDDVCNEDIKQLDILCSRVTSTSVVAAKQYRDNNMIKEVFEAALKGEDVDTALAKARLESSSSSSDMATSRELMWGAINHKLAKKIEMDYCEREKPFERPEIIVTIDKVDTGNKPRKDGSLKYGWGFDISLNGEHIPVYFGSADQTFLYASLLFAIVDEKVLKRKYFKEDAPSAIMAWLEEKYKPFYFRKKFNDWYDFAIKNDAKRIDQAVRGIREKLWEKLANGHKEAYYYLCVVNEGRYKLRLRANQIKISPKYDIK